MRFVLGAKIAENRALQKPTSKAEEGVTLHRWTKMIALVVTAFGLLISACVRGGGDSAQLKATNANNQNSNQRPANLMEDKTLHGYIDRAGLFAGGALSSSKQKNWTDVITNLQQVDREIVNAMADKSTGAERLRPEFVELKTMIDNALRNAQNGSGSTETQLIQLQTGISALRTKLGG